MYKCKLKRERAEEGGTEDTCTSESGSRRSAEYALCSFSLVHALSKVTRRDLLEDLIEV